MSNNTKPNNVTYEQIQKYVINLDNATERLEQANQFFKGNFIRVPAVNGRKLIIPHLRNYFRVSRANRIYNVGITPIQISCTLSHMQVYREILDNWDIGERDWVLVCEDDNEFIPEFETKLTQLVNYLNDPKFEYAQMCVLRMSQIKHQYDFYDAIKLVDNNQQHFSELSHAKQKLIHPDKFALLKQIYTWKYLRHNGKTNLRFDYSDVAESPNTNLYTNKQNVFVPYMMTPQSSACYLIRKSACRRIVKEYPRPFWIADDFKAFIPVQSILYCSPMLAFDHELAGESTILDATTEYNYTYNRVITTRQRCDALISHYCTFLTTGLYSEQRAIRVVTMCLLTALGMRNAYRKRSLTIHIAFVFCLLLLMLLFIC